MSDFYIFVNDESTGPFTKQELQEMVGDGEIPPETLYATEGMSTWEPLSRLLQIAPSPPKSTEPLPTDYDGNRFRALKDEFHRLCTYEEANDWDRRARQEMVLVSQVIKGVEEAISCEMIRLGEAKGEFEQQGLFKRMLGHHEAEHAIEGMISRLRQMRALLPEIINQLQEYLDLTPHNPEEKAQLIKELRHRKKELQAQKREESATMTAIRQEARVKSTHAGKTWLGFYDSGVAADERRDIRYDKEAALGPHEDAKAAIERQLLRIERDLLWLDEFK